MSVDLLTTVYALWRFNIWCESYGTYEDIDWAVKWHILTLYKHPKKTAKLRKWLIRKFGPSSKKGKNAMNSFHKTAEKLSLLIMLIALAIMICLPVDRTYAVISFVIGGVVYLFTVLKQAPPIEEGEPNANPVRPH